MLKRKAWVGVGAKKVLADKMCKNFAARLDKPIRCFYLYRLKNFKSSLEKKITGQFTFDGLQMCLILQNIFKNKE